MFSIARTSMLLWSLSTMGSANIFLDGNAVLSDSNNSKETRIIGGTEAMDDRYPYVVSLKSGSDHVCGGSLIAKDTVLTAAHCLGGLVSIAAVGDDLLGMGEEIAVKFEAIHPDYDFGTDQNDFGLIFLEESVSLDIPLLRLNGDSSLPEVGSTVYVMGWGDTDEDEFSVSLPDELMIVGLPVISNEDCDNSESGGDSYAGTIFENMLCTASEGEDACQGDSGGPLIIRGDDPESDVQVGIVSWGIGCAYLPGVFSRVSIGYDWIQEIVCATSNDPPGSLCGSTETSIPMSNPTPRPSENPTVEPTDRPTDSPTLSPSFSPTTAEPTLTPTISRYPTSSPSISSSPTNHPSVSPTISTQPTVFPSISSSPSMTPSALPTISQLPTVSLEPTFSPSSIPSHSPSISTSPTTEPSTSPSLRPSTSPTDTSSPSQTSRPTMSAVPTVKKSSRGISSNSLLLSDTSVLLDDDELEKNGSVNRMGQSRIVAIGCVMLSASIMSITGMGI